MGSVLAGAACDPGPGVTLALGWAGAVGVGLSRHQERAEWERLLCCGVDLGVCGHPAVACGCLADG